ncbi:putative HlyD family type I secretion protein [Chitinophaga flava]|uniref:HlyD family secretion protein n=1 Tax=Chitinophaga flava TaxID=2259036 RepID=A0A365XTG2_9BACT|nr:HlyD family efflux transporter periplasmic adaptor subunit [Chitinophaga flava]RBL89642.1 hypothetical protein DF182_24385 [Chitinophaga flava]
MPVGTNEQYSQEMEELIGHVPHRLIRSGLLWMLLVAIVILVLSSRIPYPELVKAKVTIYTKNPPESLIIKNNTGQMLEFLVNNRDTVSRGDTLLVRQDISTGKNWYATSPLDGIVYTSKEAGKNDTLLYSICIIPKVPGVDVYLKSTDGNVGKIKAGQKVWINLDNYPAQEYGILEGKISGIMPDVSKHEHTAIVELNSDKLITTTNRLLPQQPVMQGDAEIQIDEKSVFERIFGSVFRK